VDLERVDLNRQFRQYRQDREIDDPLTLRDKICMDFKTLRVGRNPYRGFAKGTCGGLRRIAGQKEILSKNAIGRARNHVVT
jgi:hypothetical protein